MIIAQGVGGKVATVYWGDGMKGYCWFRASAYELIELKTYLGYTGYRGNGGNSGYRGQGAI